MPRLLAEQDRLDDVGREERQRENLADIGLCLPRYCGDVFEGSRFVGGQSIPPHMRLAYGVDQRAVHLRGIVGSTAVGPLDHLLATPALEPNENGELDGVVARFDYV